MGIEARLEKPGLYDLSQDFHWLLYLSSQHWMHPIRPSSIELSIDGLAGGVKGPVSILALAISGLSVQHYRDY